MVDTPAPTPTSTPTPPWHQGIEAETLGFWQNKGYDLADPKVFATKITEHYRNAEKHLGVPQDRLLRLPDKPDDADGWKTVYQRLGAPKDVKEYDFKDIKFGDGTELDEQFTTAMRSELLKANVAKDKAPDIVKAVVKYLDDADKAEATIRESEKTAQIQKVLKDWGAHRNENELLSLQALKRLNISQADYDKLAAAMGYDWAAEKFLTIGTGLKESSYIDGQSHGPPPTAAAARAQLDQLTNDPAWGKKLLNRDTATVRQFEALSQQIADAM
jgi:hypothetical protein